MPLKDWSSLQNHTTLSSFSRGQRRLREGSDSLSMPASALTSLPLRSRQEREDRKAVDSRVRYTSGWNCSQIVRERADAGAVNEENRFATVRSVLSCNRTFTASRFDPSTYTSRKRRSSGLFPFGESMYAIVR